MQVSSKKGRLFPCGLSGTHREAAAPLLSSQGRPTGSVAWPALDNWPAWLPRSALSGQKDIMTQNCARHMALAVRQRFCLHGTGTGRIAVKNWDHNAPGDPGHRTAGSHPPPRQTQQHGDQMHHLSLCALDEHQILSEPSSHVDSHGPRLWLNDVRDVEDCAVMAVVEYPGSI